MMWNDWKFFHPWPPGHRRFFQGHSRIEEDVQLSVIKRKMSAREIELPFRSN